jgi:hypothetical protein
VESEQRLPPLDRLKQSEWNSEFEQLMRNRLLMGSFRYGRLKAQGKPQYDRMSSIIKRAQLYRQTGNQEYLADIANLCLLEYSEPNHPTAHFDPFAETEKVRTTS